MSRREDKDGGESEEGEEGKDAEDNKIAERFRMGRRTGPLPARYPRQAQ